MHVTGKGTGDGEADAGAIGVFVELNELGEDILVLIGGDANAGVFDDLRRQRGSCRHEC